MKKRFWTRLISAVLTMAMAFSILAVPASAAETAADEEGTKVGFLNPFYLEGQEAPYEWEICTIEQVKMMASYMVQQLDSDEGRAKMETAGINVELLESKKDQIQTMEDDELIAFANQVGVPVVEAPDEAVVGMSASKDGKVYWYTEEQVEKINDAMDAAYKAGTEIKWENGVFTIGEETFGPMNPDSSATIDSAVVVLAVAGAAAAATGVYLYTHPEKVEAIKDFFANLSANVQAKVHQLTTNVKGAFGIVVPDSEDEEEEPVAAAVEEAQAA